LRHDCAAIARHGENQEETAMRRMVLGLAGLTLLLSGCVLQANPPLFSETEGVLALGETQIAFDGYALKGGTWSKSNTEDPPLQFTPQGHHYVVREQDKSDSKSNTADALFVVLKDGWLALQLTEQGKPSIYSLAKRDGRDLLIAPLMCSDLEKDQATAGHIDFEGSDCTVKAVGDPRAFLMTLAKLVPPSEMKLVPTH
jgi:hypothetical protein